MSEPIDLRIVARIDTLIAHGYTVLGRDIPGLPRLAFVNDGDFAGWKTRSLAFLHDFLGEEHVYAQEFTQHVKESRTNDVSAGVSILLALRADVEAGYLTTFRELIYADMFSNFLEMAEYLLSEGYKDAATVLIGGVLEQHLRQLCAKHYIPIEVDTSSGPKPKKADTMNTDLYKEKVYNLANQKQVTAWLDLRNKAAHAEYTTYAADQISLMLQGVRGFVIRHPA